jgi:hypothetical protein
VVYVFGGDIDWLHIDTSLLLALSAPAKNIIFLKEMAAPAAADVVLFSCRWAQRSPRTRAASRAAQVQGKLWARPVQARASGAFAALFIRIMFLPLRLTGVLRA